MNKNDLFIWAVSIVREAVDKGLYGSITLNMQNGSIGNIKTESSEKPPLDVVKNTG